MKEVVDKVRAYIEREIGLKPQNLSEKDNKSPFKGDLGALFIALSGGADSTALLLIMKELGYRIEALHCNFHLRGEESNRDQAFVEELCRQQHVPLRVRHFQAAEEAAQRGISIEMAARDLRYEWFREVQAEQCSMFNVQCSIAVAHHRDDQAETLLLNLIRGTGLRGLVGMQPKNGEIIRPLLCLSREEILEYLEQEGQSYVTDSTNSERIAQRNRLRLDVIPLLQSINPAAVEHLSKACDNVRSSLPYYKKGIEAAFKEQGITEDRFPLKALVSNPYSPIPNPSSPIPNPSSPIPNPYSPISNPYSPIPNPYSLIPNPLLHEWLAGKGFNGTQEAEMLSLPPRGEVRKGAMWHSRTHTVLRDRDALIQFKIQNTEFKILPELYKEIVPCIGETGPDIAYFDADLLRTPIEVRPVHEGDAFVPLGMRGRKLVSDYLTDRKINRLQKAEQFVATCGDDIIWLIGHRSDNRYRVTDRTKRILKIRVLT